MLEKKEEKGLRKEDNRMEGRGKEWEERFVVGGQGVIFWFGFIGASARVLCTFTRRDYTFYK